MFRVWAMGAPKDGSSLVGALIMEIITYWGYLRGPFLEITSWQFPHVL